MPQRYNKLQIKRILEFGDLFDESSRVICENVLRKYSRNNIVLLAILLNKEYCNQSAEKICNMLSLFDSRRSELYLKLIDLLHSNIKSNVDYIATFETTSLELLRRAFAIPYEEFNNCGYSTNIDNLQYDTLKLVTQINEETMRYNISIENKTNLSALIYINSIYMHDILYFDVKNEYIYQLVQAVKLFEMLEKPKYRDLLQGFYDKYNIDDWREYVRTFWSIFGISIKGEGVIPRDLHIDKDSLITKSVLDEISIPCNIEFISSSCEDEYDKGGNADYRVFRDKPLFKLDNGDYAVHSRPLIINRLYGGLYFDFINIAKTLSAKHPYVPNLFTSDFVEKTLFCGLMKECVNSKIYATALDEEALNRKYKIKAGELGSPDYFLKTNHSAIIFECKDIRLNAWIKEQRSYELLEEELKNKLVCKRYTLDYIDKCHKDRSPRPIGCGQIACHMDNIRRGEFPWSKSLDVGITIYPVLVIADNNLLIPGLASIIQNWFKECLKDKGLTCEKPLIIMSPLTLLKYSDKFQTDGFEKYFEEYYESIFQMPTNPLSAINRLISFDDYMSKYRFDLRSLVDSMVENLTTNINCSESADSYVKNYNLFTD